MTGRCKRITLGVMSVGLAVVIVVAIAHWGAIRDHIDAWHFQLTGDRVTIQVNCGLPLILDLEESFLLVGGGADNDFAEPAAPQLLDVFQEKDYRVLEQRFPSKAYVVVRNETQMTREGTR